MMKTKFLMFMMAIGMFLAAPTLSYAQGMTDEDLDFQGSDSSDSEFGPVSLDPTLINGTISYTKETIKLNFLFDLSVVTVWIVDESGKLYISEEVNTSSVATTTIDIKSLPAQKYTIICFTPEGQQKAKFELHD